MLGLEVFPGTLNLKEKWDAISRSGLTPWHLRDLKVGATPSREIFSRGNLRVLAYEPPAPLARRHISRAPVLFLPSLINRHYILDLLPGRSLVGHFLNEGFPVYIVEWLHPKPEDRYLKFDDLFERRIAKAIHETLRHSNQTKLHLVGHCLGGTLAVMEALLRPERLLSLSLLTAPMDFKDAGKLGVWANSPDFDLEAFRDAYGNIPWALLQSTFQMLKPALGLSKLSRLMDRWKDPDFLMSFLAIELWSNDNISFPGLCYETVIREFYQNNSLARGRFRLQGEELSLQSLKVPTLEAIAADDHIAPPSTRLPDFTGLFAKGENPSQSATEIRRIELNGGHIGAVLGKRAQQKFWPEMSEWLKSQECAKQ